MSTTPAGWTRPAPYDVLARLAEAIARAFDVSTAQRDLNDPLAGGYITLRHRPAPAGTRAPPILR